MIILLTVVILGIASLPIAITFAVLYSKCLKENHKLKTENLMLRQVLRERQSQDQGQVLNAAEKPVKNNTFALVSDTRVKNDASIKVDGAIDTESTIQSKDICYKSKKSNDSKQTSLNWIHIGLILGVIFVFISSTIFATTNWTYLPSFIKVIIITMSTFIMYFGSYVFEKLKLKSASKSFHYIGLSLLFINVIALAFFELLPYNDCFYEQNKFLTFSIATLVVGMGLIYSVIKYKTYILKLVCATTFLVSFMLLLEFLPLLDVVKIIIVLLLNVLFMIFRKFKDQSKVHSIFITISLCLGLLFATITDYSMIKFIVIYVYGLLFFATQDKKYGDIYVFSGVVITILSTLGMSTFFVNFELALMMLNACTCLIILLFNYLKTFSKKLFVPLVLVYTVIAFLGYLAVSSINIIIIMIALMYVLMTHFLVKKNSNIFIQAIPITLMILWTLKLLILLESSSYIVIFYIIYAQSIALYIFNIFSKTFYRNVFIDLTYMILFSIMTIINMNELSVHFVYLFFLAQFILSNIIIIKEPKSHVLQVTSVISITMFAFTLPWSYDEIFTSVQIILVMLIALALTFFTFKIYDKYQTTALKVYREVSSYVFMFLGIFTTIVSILFRSVELIHYIYGLVLFIVVFILAIKKEIYARFVIPYVLILCSSIRFILIFDSATKLLDSFWYYAVSVAIYMVILLFTTIFSNNKYLKLFKIPIYFMTALYTKFLFEFTIDLHSSIEVITLLKFLYTLAIIFAMYILTCKQKDILGVKINIKPIVLYIVGAMWVYAWYFIYISLMQMFLDPILESVFLIGLLIIILGVSTIVNRFYKPNVHINIFHSLSFMLIISMRLDLFYIQLLFAVYFYTLNHMFKNNIYKLILNSLSVVTLILAFYMQKFIAIPSSIYVEYTCLAIAIAAIVLYLLWKNCSKVFEYIFECIITTLSIILLMNALFRDELLNVSIIFIISISILITAIIRRNLSWFVPYVIIVTIIVLYFTKDFWTSISWWIYLFVAGVTLITVAIINEVKLKKSSKSFKLIVANSFKSWKW